MDSIKLTAAVVPANKLAAIMMHNLHISTEHLILKSVSDICSLVK